MKDVTIISLFILVFLFIIKVLFEVKVDFKDENYIIIWFYGTTTKRHNIKIKKWIKNL